MKDGVKEMIQAFVGDDIVTFRLRNKLARHKPAARVAEPFPRQGVAGIEYFHKKMTLEFSAMFNDCVFHDSPFFSRIPAGI